MRSLTILLSIGLLAFTPYSPVPKTAYAVFTKDGKATTYDEMIKQLSEADVVFVGELHNNPICHWLELEVTKSLYETNKNMVLGAEMFEADNQLLLDEYVTGVVPEKQWKAEAKLWPNHATDYHPLVNFAKDNHLKFVATNIPRRYSNVVYKSGFEGLKELDKQTKAWMAPLPIEYDPELPGYKKMVGMMGSGHGTENLPKAQAMKDATMAYFINKNIVKDGIFVHYNGRYHSDNHEGIVWYLKKYNKKLKIMTISSAEQANPDVLEDGNKGIADFIVTIPSSMTKTY